MEQPYYVRLEGKILGPFSAQKLMSLRDRGKLPPSAEFSLDQQVWSPSLAVDGWARATAEEDYGEQFEDEFRASPPPKAPPHSPPPPDFSGRAGSYDVFVSYCREDGASIARLLSDKIRAQGFRVFLDVEGLGAGSWSQELELRINECPDFVVVLTAAYISRLKTQGSVIQQEVVTALGRGKNVVPVLVESMPLAHQLPASVAALPDANGVRYVHEYMDAAVVKLCGLLQSARVAGPERLRTDAKPRAIVACFAMVIGALEGASMGAIAGQGQPNGGIWGYASSAMFGIYSSFFLLAVLLPAALLLAGIGYLTGVRRDRLFLGPWLPFWVLFLPTLLMAASIAPTGLFLWLNYQSYFWGGIVGMVVALALTALFAFTDTWRMIGSTFAPSRR